MSQSMTHLLKMEQSRRSSILTSVTTSCHPHFSIQAFRVSSNFTPSTILTSHPSHHPVIDIMSLFDNRYKLIEELGKGSYGLVYSALDTNIGRIVALKIARSSLSREAEIYELLSRNGLPTGIPRMLRFAKSYMEYIVLEKLGKSVQHYWMRSGNHFSVKTVVLLGIQMISRLEGIHSRGIIHGDIKEDNFVFDAQCQTLYIIDFGVSCPYVDLTTGIHVPEERDESVLGTLHYSSINMHNKVRLSRRDDIESLIYMLIRLFKGTLPWEENVLCGWTFREKFDEVGQMKMTTRIDFLCEGLPEQFKQLVANVRGLGFTERPDYAQLQGLLRSALGQTSTDGRYDWMI